MKILSSLLCIVFLIGSCTNTVETTQENTTASEEKETVQKQLRHVVLFKFKTTATAEDIQKIEEAFAALPSKIETITDFEWGINNNPEGLNKGLTHCFIVTFDSEEGRKVYLPHPDHQAFVALLTPYLDDVVVVDYWT